jgi:serine/threonine protein kinase
MAWGTFTSWISDWLPQPIGFDRGRRITEPRLIWRRSNLPVKTASVQSDLYAPGLVVYEMFTGKRPFEANSMAELLRMREHGRAAPPSTIIRDVDPRVERVIMACLEPDPERRPRSALSIASELPFKKESGGPGSCKV